MSAVESLQTIESQLKNNASKNVFSPVRLSATEPVIADILAPKLGQLPAPISLDLVATTQPADLARMDADLAIRMFRPYSDELVIRKIGSLELSWFASEEYLGGRDPSAIDLNKEYLLTYSPVYGDISEVAWIKTANLENQVRHTSTSSRALFIAAKHGLGIALGSRLVYDAQDLIELPLETPPPRDLWLAYHHSNRNSKWLKAVRDWLAAAVFQD
jgi:DNA-binding transcriptional LysR family regulator